MADKKQINTGGAAFPCEGGTDSGLHPDAGMSLRDYFAANADIPWNAVIQTLAIQGYSSPTIEQIINYRAKVKYLEADAMIKEGSGSAK